jgi:hypothetical protein
MFLGYWTSTGVERRYFSPLSSKNMSPNSAIIRTSFQSLVSNESTLSRSTGLIILVSHRYKHKLQQFYAVHNPEKLSEVGDLLAKYQGKEEDLWVALNAKYGSEFIKKFNVTEPQLRLAPPRPQQRERRPDKGEAGVGQSWDGGAAANWGAAAKI